MKFFTYQCLMVSLLFVLVACSKTNQLQQVEQMMQNITSNQYSLFEEQRIQTLRDYIANNGIALEITSLDSENKNVLTDLALAQFLRIIFTQNEVSKEFILIMYLFYSENRFKRELKINLSMFFA